MCVIYMLKQGGLKDHAKISFGKIKKMEKNILVC